MTGRYLAEIKAAFKEEGRALVGRRSAPQPEQPAVQPYYEERRPPSPYDDGPPGQMTRGDFQAAIEQARRQEREDMIARMDASHHAHAERLAQVALAAVNRQNTPVEIRYRGSAHDKLQRRLAELKFWSKVLLAIAFVALIAWLYYNSQEGSGSGYALPGYATHAPMNSPHRPAHYKRSEEWDD